MAEKKWIQSAISRPGSLTKKAEKAGAITKKGTIKKEWLKKQAKKKGRTGRQARLAQTLDKLRRNKGD